MANPIFVIDIGPDGVVAAHPARTELPVLVAPVPDNRKEKDFNTIRLQLVTLGCMQLPGRGFEFDSSFISPLSADRFKKFAGLMQSLREQDDVTPKRFPPCSIFGHADPTGTDEYNKTLAGRRARAVYGLLTRNKKIWDELYNNPFGGDQWGIRSIRMMLSIPLRKGEPQFFWDAIEPGPTDAEKRRVQTLTHDAIAAYQEARKLLAKGSGFPGDKTREILFGEYMDAICRDPADEAFKLDPEKDFIARHKDGDGLKGDVQGCGDFNEIFLLTQAEEDAAKKSKEQEALRNEQYRVDRRVLVYIFKHGTEIDPVRWPCPRSKEGPAGCTIRFWSDHKDRRKHTTKRRSFGKDMNLFERDASGNLLLDGAGKPTPIKVEETGNTMACRWYHAFAVHSPCERKLEEWIVRIHVDSVQKASKPKSTQPVVGRRYVVIAGEVEFSPVIRGTTNDRGEIRIPVFDEHVTMTVKIDVAGVLLTLPPSSSSTPPPPPKPPPGPPWDDEDDFMQFTLDCGALKPISDPGYEPAQQRLFNLGYGSADFTDQRTELFGVKAFQEDYQLKSTGAIDGPTQDKIREIHGS